MSVYCYSSTCDSSTCDRGEQINTTLLLFVCCKLATIWQPNGNRLATIWQPNLIKNSLKYPVDKITFLCYAYARARYNLLIKITVFSLYFFIYFSFILFFLVLFLFCFSFLFFLFSLCFCRNRIFRIIDAYYALFTNDTLTAAGAYRDLYLST